MESLERSIAMEFPAIDGFPSCSPPTVPTWLRKRLSDPKTPVTVEEIQAKLRDADLRRQKFFEYLSSRARPKPKSPSRSSSSEDDLGQRLEAKLLAAEEKRLSILTNVQLRLARQDELRLAAKAEAEKRFKRQCAELGTKVEMRVRQAEANRLLILRAYRQRRASLKERTSQSLLRRMAREKKYKERVHAALCQKRAAADKKRLSLLEAEKRRAHARALQVQNKANSVTYQREMEINNKKNKLEDRLQRARRKRAEYLMQRGRHFYTAQSSWSAMHEQADTLSRIVARCWREFMRLSKTTISLAKLYSELNLNKMSVTSMPFEQLARLIQSPATLSTTKMFLERLECRYKLSREFGSAPNPSSWDDIDHLLKRVSPPKKKVTPKKTSSARTLSVSQAAKSPPRLPRYQLRVVLSAYMILGHPDAVISGLGERETALASSAVTFVEEFELLNRIIINGPTLCSVENSDRDSGTRMTFRSQLAAFDYAWCAFLNSFVVWKSKDARSLEEDLVRAACHLELSMIHTCKMTPNGASSPLSHDMKAVQQQVYEDQKLLREKVLHLSGDVGIERMESALSETRIKFFNARENGEPTTPLSALILSPNPVSSPVSSSDGEKKTDVGPRKHPSVVRSLFKDDANSDKVSSSGPRTIVQSAGNGLDMQNVMIVNECVHGELLAFTDSSRPSISDDNVMGKLKEAMKKAFWDGIIESVTQDESNYSRVLVLIREVRDEICSIAPSSWRGEIFEAIDLNILTQVLNSGELDIDYMGKILEYAIITIQKLSSPASEDEFKKKHNQIMKDLASENSRVVVLIQGLRFVLEQIEELKQEISKARIRMLEPLLKGPDALYYLGKAFTSRYGHSSNALVALPLTTKWLSSVRAGKHEMWHDHKSYLDEVTRKLENSSSLLPSTSLRTGGSLLVKTTENKADSPPTSTNKSYIETIDPHMECKGEEIDLLVRLGLLKLVSRVAGLTEGELPETMNFNLVRLRGVQSQFQKIIVIATSLLILRQTLVSQRIVTNQSQMESILSKSVKQLCKCLDSVEDAGIAEIVEVLSNTMKNEDITNVNLQLSKELMGMMLSKSLQEGDAVFKRVSEAVYSAARGAVLGGTKQGRNLAELALQKVVVASLVDNLVESATVLVIMAKVSVIVHGPWYANLLKEE